MTRTFSFFLMGILNQSEGVSGLSDDDARRIRGVCGVHTKEGAEAARRGGSGVDGVPEAAEKTKIYDDEAGDRNSISPIVVLQLASRGHHREFGFEMRLRRRLQSQSVASPSYRSQRPHEPSQLARAARRDVGASTSARAMWALKHNIH